MPASRNLVLASLSLCRRELVRFYRQKSRMAGVIGSPLIFWFLIGSGLGNSFRLPGTTGGLNYLEYFFPGTIVLIILFSSIFSTMSIIEDRREGFLQSVIVAPVPRSSIALGKILGGSLLSVLQAIILLALTPFMGMSLSLYAFLLTTIVLFIIAFGLTGLGFLLAWRMDSTQGFHAVMNLFLIPLWLLSGALFPAAGAAGWLGIIMAANPITYGLAALRQTLYLDGHVAVSSLVPFPVNLVVILVFALLMFVLSSISVHRPVRQAW